MKNKLVAMIALPLLVVTTSGAFAQTKQQQGQGAGWYVGVSAGRSSTSFNKEDFASDTAGIVDTTDRAAGAGRGLIGYNIDQNWAIEGAYTYLGEAKYKYSGTSQGVAVSGSSTVKNDSWSLAVKGALPLSQQFDIFGRLGWTYNRSSTNFGITARWAGFTLPLGFSASKNRSDALVGLGVEFKPQKNWGIRAEYDAYGRFGNRFNTTSDTGRTNTDMWSLGVVVRF